MEEKADVQASEITPENFDGEQVKEPEAQTPKAEPSPAKAEKPAKVEAKADTKVEKAPEPEPEAEVKPEVEDAEVEETPVDKPTAKADERKAQLNTEIRDLVAQKNALKADVEKANAEVYQPATEGELQEQGLSATDAKLEALRQQIEIKDYNDKVADAQLTLSSESERVLRDFPIFDAESTDFDKELAEEAAGLLEASLILDPNTGQVIGSNVSPYQLYKTLARATGISTAKGQMQGQKDTEQMLANADTASSASPAKKAADPLMALWEEPLV